MSNPPLKNALSHLYFRIYNEATRQKLDCRGWYEPNSAVIAGYDNQRDNRVTNVYTHCILHYRESLEPLKELCSLYVKIQKGQRPTIAAWWSVGDHVAAK